MTAPSRLLDSADVQRFAAAIARAQRAQQRAQRRGQFRPLEDERPPVPEHRARLAAAMPYPQAHLAHLDSTVRADVNRWLAALTDAEPRLDMPAPGNLLLLGPAGTGKTVAACAVAGHLSRDLGWRVVYCRLGDLLDDERPDGAHELRPRMLQADCVVLDDLGAVGLTQWGDDTLTAIVDQLVHPPGGGPPTVLIITANYGPAQLATALPERLHSRLTTGAWAFVVNGHDRRGEQLADMGDPDPETPCPHGCDAGGWLRVSQDYVEQVVGPPPRDVELDEAADYAVERHEQLNGPIPVDDVDPDARDRAVALIAAAGRVQLMTAWRARAAAAANTVRPCPHCRRPPREPIPTEDDDA